VNPLTALDYARNAIHRRRISRSIPFSINIVRHDHRHQHASRLSLLLLDPAQLFAPTEQLTDMDTGRAGNLGSV
jgi:hypothetical protein